MKLRLYAIEVTESEMNLSFDTTISINQLEDWRDKLGESMNFEEGEKQVFKVKPCHDMMFHGISCLETEDQFGFFKSEGDVRPSSCTWVDKDKAESMYELLKGEEE